MADTTTVAATTNLQEPEDTSTATTGTDTTEVEKLKTQLKQAEHVIETLKKEPKTPAAPTLEEIKKQLVEDETFKKSLISTIPVSELEKQLSETKAALQSEAGKNKGGTAASVKIEPETEIEVSPQVREIIQRVASRNGISFEEAAKKFKK